LHLNAESLFGAVVGQGVVWYSGQFYPLYYLQTVLKIQHLNLEIRPLCITVRAIFAFLRSFEKRKRRSGDSGDEGDSANGRPRLCGSSKIIFEERFQRLPFADELHLPDLLHLLIPFLFLLCVFATLRLCVEN